MVDHMTWAEFKQRAEAQGIKDDDEVWYIDINGWELFTATLHINGWTLD